MNKIIKDGKVAVLIYPCFGSGWSYIAQNQEEKDKFLFCPEIVSWIESGRDYPIDDIIKEKFGWDLKQEGRIYGYILGVLEIEWVNVGRKFFIEEYDGLETVKFYEDIDWQTA